MSHKSEEGTESTQDSSAHPASTHPATAQQSVRRSKPTSGNNSRGTGRFLLGAASGVALAVLAPLFSKPLRPVAKGAIKGGIATGRYVQKIAEGVVEDFQDMTAEARAELARDETPRAEAPPSAEANPEA
jgi:hypothetical protein